MAHIQYGIRPGESWLIGYTEDEVWDHIMAPIENLQCQALRDHGRRDLLPLVPKYNAFLILLGMVRPMQVEGVWDRKGLLYNPYMANMLTRRQYYLLQRLLRTNVVSLLEDCTGQLAGAWCMGDGACGDESVVPHKGMLAGPLKMFIARKPHPTGIKLYCLVDATWGYVVDMTKRSTYGVTWAGEQMQEGQTAVCTVADFKYSLCVYKNPKVGHKPPRVVPMLTNVWFA